ncbi:hypothetical protein F5Y18DRAFT_292407 [Xylariaceae sp. FL1019]|nr:hypothetical protein F5Y18DRAFT_292407 [Xylariaceae sp. FL1019]
MGRQDSSPHRQRHRMPHQRRRRHDHQKHAKLAHPESQLSLGNLNRAFQKPGGKARVESWLGQVAGPAENTGLTSKRPRRLEIYSAEQPRLQHDDTSPANQIPGRVDPLWRPKHINPANGVTPESFSPPTGQEFGLKRYKRNSSGNSSLISDYHSPSESRRQSRCHTPVEDRSQSLCGPWDETELDYARVPSSMSHERNHTQTFGKQPRRKTKADKYDTKKQNDRKRRKLATEQKSIQDEKRTTEPPARKEKRKKKSGASGKNVMNKFTSEAVLNDRITVQHGLRPGLFENGRGPRKGPVLDLSFSDMEIRKQGVQGTQPSKPLSKSQRQDRQREERQREQISSFFIAPNNLPKAVVSYAEDHRDDEVSSDGHDGMELVHERKHITSPCDSHSGNHHEEYQRHGRHRERETSPVMSSTRFHDCRPDSSRATSYLTWSSSSLNVPHDAQACVNKPPSLTGQGRSETPETIRRAVVNTGIYRDTRIRPYDDWTNEQTAASATDSDSISSNNELRDLRDPPSPSTTIFLKEKWNEILPPEWKSANAAISTESVLNNRNANTDPALLPDNNNVHHQERVQENDTRHAQEKSYLPDSYCQDKLKKAYPFDNYMPFNRNHEVAAQYDESGADRHSIASRDAMPPPPIPEQGRRSLDVTDHRQRDCRTHCEPESASAIDCARYDIGFPIYDHERDTETPIPFESGMGTDTTIPLVYSNSRARDMSARSNLDYNMDKMIYCADRRSPVFSPRDSIRNSSRSHPPDRQPESMTEFITRIETEVSNQEDFSRVSDAESITSSSGSLKNPAQSAFEDQCGLLSTPDPLRADQDGYQPMPAASELDPSGLTVLSTAREGGYGSIREGIGTSTDEFLEMSSFWRPNQFALS